jgi:hypothetical protein
VKAYRRFIAAFLIVLALYIVAEINRPKPVNWQVSLSKAEKSPYGAYIIYQQLKDIFPKATVTAYRQPVYNQINNFKDSNTAYLLLEPSIDMSRDDLNELLNYAVIGNYVFIAAGNFSQPLMDTLKFKLDRRFEMMSKDSTSINFTSPAMRADSNYGFMSLTIDGYFSKIDTLQSFALGQNQHRDINFIKIPYGDGAFFIHAAPICFSNYFMLTGQNANYTAKALSYLPKQIKYIYWDEFYKLGPEGSDSPLRFILNNTWLRWAFRIGLLTMVLFVFFEMKRVQRVIPVIAPPRNSSLDFVQTVGSVYFNQHDNKNIALKKISYFMEHVRSVFYLGTQHYNDVFIQALSKKSGVQEQETRQLVQLINEIQAAPQITDEALVRLNNQIDSFYEKAT